MQNSSTKKQVPTFKMNRSMEEVIIIASSIMMATSIIPFSIYRYFNGQYAVAMIELLSVMVMCGIGVYVWQTRSIKYVIYRQWKKIYLNNMIPQTQQCHPNKMYQSKMRYYNTKLILHNVMMIIRKLHPNKLWQQIINLVNNVTRIIWEDTQIGTF